MKKTLMAAAALVALPVMASSAGTLDIRYSDVVVISSFDGIIGLGLTPGESTGGVIAYNIKDSFEGLSMKMVCDPGSQHINKWPTSWLIGPEGGDSRLTRTGVKLQASYKFKDPILANTDPRTWLQLGAPATSGSWTNPQGKV